LFSGDGMKTFIKRLLPEGTKFRSLIKNIYLLGIRGKLFLKEKLFGNGVSVYKDTFFHIDFFSNDDGILKIDGWLFNTKQRISSINLLIKRKSGQRIFALYNFLKREDVYNHFGNINAKNSGFSGVIIGFDGVGKLSLLVKLGNGKTKKISIDKRVNKLLQKNDYDSWIEKNEPNSSILKKQRRLIFRYQPKFSIIVVATSTDNDLLRETLKSVLSQTYSNWELCIATDTSSEGVLREEVSAFWGKIRHISIGKKENYANVANRLAGEARGDYVMFLGAMDVLPAFSLFEITRWINKNGHVDLIYSDEDRISNSLSKRYEPLFKPDFSIDMFRSFNYLGRALAVSRNIGEYVGWFRSEFKGACEFDFLFRIYENTDAIYHVPKILYHRRDISSYAVCEITTESEYNKLAKKALKEHFDRMDINANISEGMFINSFKINYVIDNSPLISIIIPNKDQENYLRRCVNSIFDKTSYKNYEIIIIENGSTKKSTFELYDELSKDSRVSIINWDREFNYSAVNNFAAKQAKGDYYLFLNNDIKVLSSDWIEAMLGYAQREDVGAVGAKLYYADETIQHGGIIIGNDGFVEHAHRYLSKYEKGYMNRAMLPQNLSAVTGACLMIRKDVFNEVGGFDEKFVVDYNDVDLCLRIRKKNYLVVWTPYSQLYHFESKTRGNVDNRYKLYLHKNENQLFIKRWAVDFSKGDPYYNPNLTFKKKIFSIGA